MNNIALNVSCECNQNNISLTRNQINPTSFSPRLRKRVPVLCCVYFVLTKYIFAGYEDTDFDRKALGMWKNAGQIQWRRKQFFTQTKETGPSRDHTTGKGLFQHFTLDTCYL